MKCKVGLVTWHYYENVGSNLQAYALYTTLKKLGANPCFINYRNSKFDDNFVKYALKKIFTKLNKIHIISDRSKYAFKSFQFQNKYFKMTKRYNNVKKILIENDFDTIICGSDQIWAPSVFNDVYFLSFVSNKKKKNSYAASIGENFIPNSLKEKYKELLSQFNNIGIREKQGKKLLNELNIDSKVVLDPSLLLDESDWNAIANEKFTKKIDNYIFCYMLGNNKNYLSIIKGYAKEKKLNVIMYSPNKFNDEFDIYFDKLGPEEFIALIKKSKYVFTDSFHGFAMSVIFKKELRVFLRFNDNEDKNSQNSRIYNLAELLGLSNIIINKYNDVNSEKINYDIVFRKLKKLKIESINYLKSIIGENNEK